MSTTTYKHAPHPPPSLQTNMHQQRGCERCAAVSAVRVHADRLLTVCYLSPCTVQQTERHCVLHVCCIVRRHLLRSSAHTREGLRRTAAACVWRKWTLMVHPIINTHICQGVLDTQVNFAPSLITKPASTCIECPFVMS